MLIILGTFGLAFAFIEACFRNGFGHIGYSLQVAIYNLLCGETWSHMWYIYMLLGMYFFLPMLRSFIKCTERKEFVFFLGALLLFCSIVPTINFYMDWKLKNVLPVESIYMLYFLMGYYLRVTEMKVKEYTALIILGGWA